MAKKNIAELFVDILVLAGVKRVYGVAGDSLNGITDVIRTDERINGFTSGTKKRPRLLLEPKRI
jgi:thiamine pyrophosphate-dependent acetolactate synthase large subunit-like protein